MKTARLLSVIPLVLISLMDLGYPFGNDPQPRAAIALVVAVLGVAGLLACYGVVRKRAWGLPAAAAAAAGNVVGALVALAADEEGAVVGLVVSGLALVIVLVGRLGAGRVSVA